MLKLAISILAAIVSAVTYYIYNLLQKRKQLDGLPQPPMLNPLVGHLHIADECNKLFKGMHPHNFMNYIRIKHDLPQVFYMDWRPFGPTWVIIGDPEIASQYVTTHQSLLKSPWETDYLNQFLGIGNMISIEGSHHKFVRSIFNPSFSVSNIMNLVPQIVDDVVIFRDKLSRLAESNEWFRMEEAATQLTIDVIGRVTFDIKLDCQKSPHKIAELFRRRMTLMRDVSSIFPWDDFSITRPFKLWWNYRQLDRAINEELDRQILRRAAEYKSDRKTKNKSSINLALNAYEKEQAMGNVIGERQVFIDTPDKLPASLRLDLVMSIKSFVFAGHDRSSSVIAWTFYMLHRYPEVQSKIVAELAVVYGKSSDIAEGIRNDPYSINKLEYITAVIKETMRIFPPASTVRCFDEKIAGHTAYFTDRNTGKKLPLSLPGNAVWPVVHMINRNERFFPEPTKFVPERFIQAQTPYPDTELFTPAGKDAFRPFERGPRACIGSELAMIEVKITIAACIQDFDFVAEYPGEEADPRPPIPKNVAEEVSEETEYGKALREAIKTGKPFARRYEGHRPFSLLAGTAKPTGGLPGRIYLRK